MDPRPGRPRRQASYANRDRHPDYIPTNRRMTANDMAASESTALHFPGSIEVRRRSRSQSPNSGSNLEDLDSRPNPFETDDFDLEPSDLDDLDDYNTEDLSDIDDNDGNMDPLSEGHHTQQPISAGNHAHTDYRPSPTHARYPGLGTIFPHRIQYPRNNTPYDSPPPTTPPGYTRSPSPSPISTHQLYHPPSITLLPSPPTTYPYLDSYAHPPSSYTIPYHGHGNRTHTPPRRRGGISHPPIIPARQRYPNLLAFENSERDSEAEFLADEEAVERVRRWCVDGGGRRRRGGGPVFTEIQY